MSNAVTVLLEFKYLEIILKNFHLNWGWLSRFILPIYFISRKEFLK